MWLSDTIFVNFLKIEIIYIYILNINTDKKEVNDILLWITVVTVLQYTYTV